MAQLAEDSLSLQGAVGSSSMTPETGFSGIFLCSQVLRGVSKRNVRSRSSSDAVSSKPA